MKNDSLKEQYRINERIRVREVRLVGDNIETRSEEHTSELQSLV